MTAYSWTCGLQGVQRRFDYDPKAGDTKVVVVDA